MINNTIVNAITINKLLNALTQKLRKQIQVKLQAAIEQYIKTSNGTTLELASLEQQAAELKKQITNMYNKKIIEFISNEQAQTLPQNKTLTQVPEEYEKQITNHIEAHIYELMAEEISNTINKYQKHLTTVNLDTYSFNAIQHPKRNEIFCNIKKLSNLRSFTAPSINLTIISEVNSPASHILQIIESCTKLEKLDLSELFTGTEDKNIEHTINNILRHIAKLKNLKILIMLEIIDGISLDQFKQIYTTLSTLDKLEYFSLNNFPANGDESDETIEQWSDAYKIFFTNLAKCKNLTSLNLSRGLLANGNGFHVFEFSKQQWEKVISGIKLLTKNTKLTSLNLSDQYLPSANQNYILALNDLFGALNSITSLTLDEVLSGENTTLDKSFYSALTQLIPQLKYLYFSNNYLGSSGISDLANAFIEATQECKNLPPEFTISLYSNELEKLQMCEHDKLFDAFKKYPNLNLDLLCNGFQTPYDASSGESQFSFFKTISKLNVKRLNFNPHSDYQLMLNKMLIQQSHFISINHIYPETIKIFQRRNVSKYYQQMFMLSKIMPHEINTNIMQFLLPIENKNEIEDLNTCNFNFNYDDAQTIIKPCYVSYKGMFLSYCQTSDQMPHMLPFSTRSILKIITNMFGDTNIELPMNFSDLHTIQQDKFKKFYQKNFSEDLTNIDTIYRKTIENIKKWLKLTTILSKYKIDIKQAELIIAGSSTTNSFVPSYYCNYISQSQSAMFIAREESYLQQAYMLFDYKKQNSNVSVIKHKNQNEDSEKPNKKFKPSL